MSKKIIALSVLCALVPAALTGCSVLCNHEWETTVTRVDCEKEEVYSKCTKCGMEEVDENRTVKHDFNVVAEMEATCGQEGEIRYLCSRCGETGRQVFDRTAHALGEYKIVKKPTLEDYGSEKAVCEECGSEVERTLSPLGWSKDNPYEISPKKLYSDINNGNGKKYYLKHLSLTGKVKSVSNYSDVSGYYLYGSKGEGVVCWVYERNQSVRVGETVTFVGCVKSDPSGGGNVEITYCEVKK